MSLRFLELVNYADMSIKRKTNEDQFTRYAWYEKLISRLPFFGENSHMHFLFPFWFLKCMYFNLVHISKKRNDYPFN